MNPSVNARPRPRVVLATALALLVAGNARAQEPDRAVEFDDLGFIRPWEAGARATALAGAFAAITNDAASLAHNPAALARVQRVVASIAAGGASARVESDFRGSVAGDAAGTLGLDLLAFAFPIPVHRGSFVPAVAVHRQFSGTFDLRYEGRNDESDRAERFFLQHRASLYAYEAGFGIDVASVASAGLSVVLLDGTVRALRQYDYEVLDAMPSSHVFVVEDSEEKASGYGARVGMEIYVHRRVRLGMVFATPLVVRTHGESVVETTEQIENQVGTFRRETRSVGTEYVVPYRAEGGLAVSARRVTAAVQAVYADWKLAAIDERRLRGRSESVFREVLELRAGVEWSLPRWPVRLRAGYARRPHPLKYLQADRIEGNRLERVSGEPASNEFALGAGVLLRRSMAVEAAYLDASIERSAESVSQRDAIRRVCLQASYWF